MPPTKAMGGIKQNCRGHPTATPLSTSGYSGVVRFGRARERRHRLMGAYSGQNLAGEGFDTLAELRWEDQIGPSILAEKINHTTINRRGPLNVRQLAVGRNGRPVCGDRNSGEYSTLRFGWKAWPIGDRAVHFNGSARSHSMKTPQSTSVRLGWG
jgi:hypothetical protein